MKNNHSFAKKLIGVLMFMFVFSVLISPVVSFAQQTGNQPKNTGSQTGNAPKNNVVTKIQNPIKVSSINGFIKIILEGVIKLGLPIVALALVYCGFLFVQARGKSKELEEAKKALLYTIIGAAILLGSWTIAQLISETVLSL